MQNDSVIRAGMLFGILVGMAAGVLSLFVPIYIWESVDSSVVALLSLAATWMLYAVVACRLSPRGFDTAWPGLVGFTLPLSLAAFIVPQWPEVEPAFRWIPLLSLAVGSAGLVAGVVVERRLPRIPSLPRRPGKPPTTMPAPFGSGIRAVLGWLLLALWAGAWAVRHLISSILSSTRASSVGYLLMAVLMGWLSMSAADSTWTSVKSWREHRRQRP